MKYLKGVIEMPKVNCQINEDLSYQLGSQRLPIQNLIIIIT